jgi:hypothetical protein
MKAIVLSLLPAAVILVVLVIAFRRL